MKMDDVFTFGKFKGYTLRWCCEYKGSYVGWCIENIPGFKIEPQSLHDKFMEGYAEWKIRIENRKAKRYEESNINYTPYKSAIDIALREDCEQGPNEFW